ncbi:MAG: tetratricopeptide repeat protein [Lentisphaerae bacterium]|jgi:TolA-binding protein|nr:tetratricopeptide repeat protein [Lentisphaerota bacterium]
MQSHWIFNKAVPNKHHAKCLLLVLVSLCSLIATAVDLPYELELDIDFVRKLGELELTDYAEMQLRQMGENYPNFNELVELEKARYYYAVGKSRLADTAIEGIKKTSPFYTEAVLLKAQVAALRRNFQAAEKSYAEYFSIVKTAPKRRAEREEFTKAIRIYNKVLTEMGKGKEAAKILDLLPMDDSGGSERQITFLKLQAQLDAEAALQKDKKPINTGAVNSIIAQLKRLQFDRDGVSAASSLQTARAQVMLGFNALLHLPNKENNKFFIEAIKTINMVDPFLEELEKVRGRDASLIPEAMFLKGQAIRGNAEVMHHAKKLDLAAKQLKGAAVYFETMLTEYPNSSKRAEALIEHKECANVSDRLGLGLKFDLNIGDGSSEIEAKIEQAQSLFVQRKYEDAMKIYYEAIRAGRRSKKLPKVALRLLICLGQLDRLAEGEALLSYLVEAFPSEKETADAAFRFGGVLYERAKNEKNPSTKELLESIYLWSWGHFVTLDPGHPKAPDVAYTVAQGYFSEAANLARAANAEKDPEKKEALQERTRESYRKAIPHFRQMTEIFAAFDKGILAWYKLGWIYYFLNDRQHAAEAFLKYYEEEDGVTQERKENRLEAKFRAAEQLLLGDNPEDALHHFEDIEKETAAGGAFDPNAEKTKAIREQAAAFKPLVFDLAADQLRPQLNDVIEQKNALDNAGLNFKNQKATCETATADLNKEKNDAQRNAAEMAEAIARLDLDFEARAKKQATEQSSVPNAKVTYQDAYNKLRPAIEKATADEADGIIKEIQELEEQDRKSIEALKLEVAAAQETINNKQAAVDDDAKELNDLKEQIKARKHEFAKVEEAITTAEAEKQRLEAILNNAQTKYEDAEEDEKEDVKKEVEKAQEDLNESTRKLEVVYAEKQKKVTDEAKAELEAWEKKYNVSQEELNEKLRLLQHDKNTETVAQAKLKAITAKHAFETDFVAFAKAILDAMAKTPEERAAINEKLKKQSAALLEKQKKATAESMASLQLQLDILAKYQQEADKAIADIQKKKDELDAQVEPVKKEYDSKKNKAVMAYQEYLKNYSTTNNAPINLARLAGTLLELGRHKEAVDNFQTLIRDYAHYNDQKPECDPQKASQALFSLAQAQTEAGMDAEAAATFKRLVNNPRPKLKAEVEQFSVARLRTIADLASRVNAHEATYFATQELLKRISTKSKDTASLSKGTIEMTYIAAAEAALRSNKPKEAVELLDKLLAYNPRTALFFQVKFLQAEARASMTPPDLDGAERALNEITIYTKDPTVSNRAICKAGDLLVRSGDPEKQKQAIARYQMIINFADYSNKANHPYIEQSIIATARLNKKNNEPKETNEKLYQTYRKYFPNGQFLEELGRLR